MTLGGHELGPDMTLRRLPACLALAALVGVLAHLAAFGSEHAPGGAGAPELLGGVLAALALAGLLAFLDAALRRSPGPVAAKLSRGYAVAALAAAGFASYGLIELAEGHFALGSALRALLAVLPIAAVVWGIATRVGSAAERAGAALAAFAASPGIAAAGLLLRPEPAFAAQLRHAHGTPRGRAPPTLR
jgi:hypothetical protein